ncbi:MAG: hypothetical protein ACXADB_05335 [Candidatus Hermodarchaeia archaeon]|jgi:hypothetical protein
MSLNGGEFLARFKTGDVVRVGEGAIVMIVTIDRGNSRYLGVGINQKDDGTVTLGPIWVDLAYEDVREASGHEYREFKRVVFSEYKKMSAKMVLFTDICIKLGYSVEELSIIGKQDLPDPLKDNLDDGVDANAIQLNLGTSETNPEPADSSEEGVDESVQCDVQENTE